jgi:isopentenyldiphosphate isomerase
MPGVGVGKMYGKDMSTSHTSYSVDTLASQNALHLMELADVDCFAVDDMITLTQSHAWAGWNRDEIFLTKLSAPLPVPDDIEQLRQEKLPVIQKNFINSSHYRLAAFTPAFSDRRGLEVTLAPIGFYDFYTLIPFLDESLVAGSSDREVSIREKYGHLAFTYTPGNTCPVPAPVALHCVVVTKDQQIILMQRSNSVAFYPNHWSASFEETMDAPGMSPKGNKRLGDADFFACAVRGIEEELGVTAEAIDTIKVLSLNIEYLILATAVVAIIKTHLAATEVKSHWLMQAPDRNEASKFATVSIDPSAVLTKLFEPGILWHPTARMRLIQFLFHSYGVKEVTALLKARKL